MSGDKISLQPNTEQFELKTNLQPDGSQEVRLILRGALDRESVSQYRLQAIAVDGGDPEEYGILEIIIIVADANDNHPVFDQDTYEVTIEENVPIDPIPTETLVIIHVDDVNDNAPEIMIHTLGDSGDNEAVILENTVSGTFVARIVVNDRDSDDNGRYNCSLYEDHFVLDPFGSDFLITTRGILDREKRSKFSLIIKCHDYGKQALTRTTFLQVSIEDINDNCPHFFILI
ncbi:hypothetical protein LSH36_288g04030 [Paralvinella palmiformis]|uniref:Cadherin domain-containing protein n=1 Tax=Paralvinella palmiformis TaxID=53620 RepID=A0AAD9JJQ0_9ANNE|nr:hypothetical protein LSH36_288g04030 [Paralvinella palmiformis]